MKNSALRMAAILVSAFPTAAFAQDLPVLDLGPGILSHAGDIALSQSLKNYYRKRGVTPKREGQDLDAGGANAFAASRRGGTATTSNASFAYTSTPALRKQALAEFVGRASKTQPAAASVGEQLTRHDYNAIWRGIAGRYGLSANDAADTLTAYTVLGWLIANGADDTNPTAVRAARAQIAAQSAANPQFRSPAERANLGEEFKILLVILHSGWQAAMREGTLATYRKEVADMFAQQSGADLRALDLTSAGFVSR